MRAPARRHRLLSAGFSCSRGAVPCHLLTHISPVAHRPAAPLTLRAPRLPCPPCPQGTSPRAPRTARSRTTRSGASSRRSKRTAARGRARRTTRSPSCPPTRRSKATRATPGGGACARQTRTMGSRRTTTSSGPGSTFSTCEALDETKRPPDPAELRDSAVRDFPCFPVFRPALPPFPSLLLLSVCLTPPTPLPPVLSQCVTMTQWTSVMYMMQARARALRRRHKAPRPALADAPGCHCLANAHVETEALLPPLSAPPSLLFPPSPRTVCLSSPGSTLSSLCYSAPTSRSTSPSLCSSRSSARCAGRLLPAAHALRRHTPASCPSPT